MGTLSIWTYYRSNKRKVGPILAIIMLSILAISTAGVLTGSLFEDVRREFALFEHYAVVSSRQASGLSDELRRELESHPAVAAVLPMASPGTRTRGIFGDSQVRVYYLQPEQQRQFADRLGWRLVDGRWPQAGTNEIAMTENFLRNRGLALGDRIGREVDEEDFLAGEWLIVGAFPATGVSGGIGDRDYYMQRFAEPDLPAELARRPRQVALEPVAGKEADLEMFLDSLPTDKVRVFHRSLAEQELASEIANADMIIWILNAVTIVVLTLAVGLLNVIFFMQRANEFGLLAALGYTKQFLIRRTFLEAAVTVAAGWALGVLFSQSLYSVVNATLFTPKGLAPLSILTPRVLLFTVPVPITVVLFSVTIVLWQLWRMDPVAIIERRD